MKEKEHTLISLQEELYKQKVLEKKHGQIVRVALITFVVTIVSYFVKGYLFELFPINIVLIVGELLIAIYIGKKAPWGRFPAVPSNEEVNQDIISRLAEIDREDFELMIEIGNLRRKKDNLKTEKDSLEKIIIKPNNEKRVNKEKTIQNIFDWANRSNGHGLDLKKFEEKMNSENWEEYLIQIANACEVEVIYK